MSIRMAGALEKASEKSVVAPPPPSIPSRNLDILRSIAVFIVFSAHLTLALNGGRIQHGKVDLITFGKIGVIIFFVLTSLVLMSSMDRMRDAGLQFCGKFYIRRAFRIYPLSILTCVAVSLAHIPTNLTGSRFVWTWERFAGNVFLVQKFLGIPNLSDPLWSLSYEVGMYFFLPFIYLLLRKYPGKGALIGLLAASLILSRVGVYAPYLQFSFYAPFFVLGAVIHGLMPHRRSWFPWWTLLLAMAALTAPMALLPMKMWSNILFCASLGGLILFAAECDCKFVYRPAYFIARYSYGIYLAHCPLMWVFYRYLIDLPSWQKHLGFAVSVIVLPIVTYHCVEAPMVALGKSLTDKSKAG
jgi:peptidoglycan/LPS O-acetylase OafA/YrhL